LKVPHFPNRRIWIILMAMMGLMAVAMGSASRAYSFAKQS
jgi:hypothetical protein